MSLSTSSTGCRSHTRRCPPLSVSRGHPFNSVRPRRRNYTSVQGTGHPNKLTSDLDVSTSIKGVQEDAIDRHTLSMDIRFSLHDTTYDWSGTGVREDMRFVHCGFPNDGLVTSSEADGDFHSSIRPRRQLGWMSPLSKSDKTDMIIVRIPSAYYIVPLLR